MQDEKNKAPQQELAPDGWFMMVHENRRGPFSAKLLVAKLSAEASPQEVLVWRRGFAEWLRAGDVPDIAVELPPPAPTSQQQPDPRISEGPREPSARLVREPRPTSITFHLAPEWGFSAAAGALLIGALLATGAAQWAVAWQALAAAGFIFYLACVWDLQRAVHQLHSGQAWTNPLLTAALHLVPLVNAYWMFYGWPRELSRASKQLRVARLGGLLFLALLGFGLLARASAEAVEHGAVRPGVAIPCLTLSVVTFLFVPFALLSEARTAIDPHLKPGGPGITALVRPASAGLIVSVFAVWAAVEYADLRYDPVQHAAGQNRQGRFTEAEAILTRRVTSKHSDADAYRELAGSLRSQGREHQAIQNYREAIRLNPDDAETLSGLASLLRLQEATFEESVTLYRKALSLKPTDTAIAVDLSSVLRQLSDDLWDLQYQEDERTKTGVLNQSTLNLISGAPKRPLEQRAQAARDESCALCRRVTQEDPQNARAHLGLGLCHFDNGPSRELQLAKKEFEQAVALSPKSATAHSYLGETLVLMNSDEGEAFITPGGAKGPYLRSKDLAKVEQGLSHLRAAVELDRKSSRAWWKLVEMLSSLGRHDEMSRTWSEGFQEGALPDPHARAPREVQ